MFAISPCSSQFFAIRIPDSGFLTARALASLVFRIRDSGERGNETSSRSRIRKSFQYLLHFFKNYEIMVES